MIAKAKHQRLVLVGLAVAALIAAVLLAMWGLKDRAAYFVTPSDIAAGKAGSGSMRLGGMVERGTLQKLPDGVTLRFTVSDLQHQTPVQFAGIAPSLFKEGSGVVAEGRLRDDGVFIADEILAKHDERYMPPQLANEVAPR